MALLRQNLFGDGKIGDGLAVALKSIGIEGKLLAG